MSVSITGDKIFEWFEKIKSYFDDYKPEPKSMTINYSTKTCSIEMLLTVDDGYRKKHRNIKIPAYSQFTITKMQDITFTRIEKLWKLIGDEWVLNAKELPSGNTFFIEITGVINANDVNNLIHIKPSVNPDTDEHVDRYWLDASLNNPKMLEDIWNELQIDEINVGVKINVNKMFAMRIPALLKEKSDAIQEYIDAGLQGDRNEIHRTKSAMRKQFRLSGYTQNDFLNMISNLTTRETLLNYLTIENNYRIGDLKQPNYRGWVPQNIHVEAVTKLTLKNYQSIGYLTLKKKQYLEKIDENIDEIINRK